MLARQRSFPPSRPPPPMPALRSCSPSGAARSSKCGPVLARSLSGTGCPLDQSRPQPMPLPTGRPNPLPFPTPPIASARIPQLGPRTRSGPSSDCAGGPPATSVRRLTFALRDARCTTVHHCTRESCSQDNRTETYSSQAGLDGRLPACRQLPLSLQQLCHRRGRNSSC